MNEPLLKLNLGGGPIEIPGYLNVDRKNGGEVFPIKLPKEIAGKLPGSDGSVQSGTIDAVRASHVLEHLSMREAREAVKEWARVLKPGGVLEIAVPNFDFIHDEYAKHRRGEPFDEKIFGYLFGGQQDADDFHRSAMNQETLEALMEDAGLEKIEPWVSDAGDCASLPCSLNRRGVKAAKPKMKIPKPSEVPKIAGIMSMPRLAFSQNMFCALQVLAPLGIEMTKMEGAFWGQCMERGIEGAMERAVAEYCLFIDYDSVFNMKHFLSLLDLMKRYPEADAIAPMQVKRDENCLIVGLLDKDRKPFEKGANITPDYFEPELLPASFAHFGLTFIRTAAIRKMKKPLFWSTPNKEGGWGEGRIDDDIYFWRNFAAAGNKLFLASHVGIGHLQLQCTWPGNDLSPIHQAACDFPNVGPPEGVRR